jgi:hypothetical protein
MTQARSSLNFITNVVIEMPNHKYLNSKNNLNIAEVNVANGSNTDRL